MLPSISVSDVGLRSVKVVDADVAGLEEDLTTGRQPRRDEILDDLMLRINGNCASACESAEIDAMAAAAEAQLDAVMGEAELLQPLADAGFNQQVDGALFEQAGANPLFDVLAAASFEHDGLDAREVEQMREHQARRSRADDADLSAMIHLRWADILLVVVLGRLTTIGSFVPSKKDFCTRGGRPMAERLGGRGVPR